MLIFLFNGCWMLQKLVDYCTFKVISHKKKVWKVKCVEWWIMLAWSSCLIGDTVWVRLLRAIPKATHFLGCIREAMLENQWAPWCLPQNCALCWTARPCAHLSFCAAQDPRGHLFLIPEERKWTEESDARLWSAVGVSYRTGISHVTTQKIVNSAKLHKNSQIVQCSFSSTTSSTII